MAKRVYKGRIEAYDNAVAGGAAASEFDAQERTMLSSASPKAWASNPAAAGEKSQSVSANYENLTPGQAAGEERVILAEALPEIEYPAV